MLLKDKNAVVTGAARNMGRAIARRLASEGANVAIVDLDEKSAEITAKEISEEFGVKTLFAGLDVRDRKGIFGFMEHAEEHFGTIDILINNAGGSAGLLGKMGPFIDADEETIDFVLDINIKGTINCIQGVLRGMVDRRYGKIVNIASIAGVTGLVDHVDYSAAKGGIIAMTKALAIEVGRYEVNVNAISPGAIERGGVEMPHMTYLGENGRSGTPEELAEAVLFLVTDNAKFITGENLVVDGGRTLGAKGR